MLHSVYCPAPPPCSALVKFQLSYCTWVPTKSANKYVYSTNNISRFIFITPPNRCSHPVDVLQLGNGWVSCRIYNDFIFAGRQDNSTELVSLTWRQTDIYAHARTRFPVLQSLEFEILRGAPKSSMVEIPELTGTTLKTAIPDGSYVRL